MSTIASLAVLLKGGTGHFSKSMKRGRRDLGTFRTAALSVRRTVRTMGIAIAGAAVAGGVALAAMTRRSMATVDSTAKLSDVLGISTEELVRLRHAADLSGISSQEPSLHSKPSSQSALSTQVGTGGSSSQTRPGGMQLCWTGSQ